MIVVYVLVCKISIGTYLSKIGYRNIIVTIPNLRKLFFVIYRQKINVPHENNSHTCRQVFLIILIEL